ncbi:MAG: hypothetical protein M3Q89_13005 [Verrucomicrobiota bacterium]|nr:hypothetical protein [Verrucomicrobiota bacterium]
MSEEPKEEVSQSDELRVPMPDVVAFVRQLSHDLRNSLNAVELQSAYLNEVAVDPEVKSEVKRLRGMLSNMGANLQRLTTLLAQIKLTEMSYKASDLMEDLREKVGSEFPEQSAGINWNLNVAGTPLQIDPQFLQQALLELFANAFQHDRGEGPLEVTAQVEAGQFLFQLREPKKDFAGATSVWGREPFRKVRHGHYGLGLFQARTIIEAHRGQFRAFYDASSSSLVTTVVLPVGTGDS